MATLLLARRWIFSISSACFYVWGDHIDDAYSMQVGSYHIYIYIYIYIYAMSQILFCQHDWNCATLVLIADLLFFFTIWYMWSSNVSPLSIKTPKSFSQACSGALLHLLTPCGIHTHNDFFPGWALCTFKDGILVAISWSIIAVCLSHLVFSDSILQSLACSKLQLGVYEQLYWA